jgi:DNA adenine methylase
MNRIFVPPIKCQGIKTKIVPLILANAEFRTDGIWYEPFMGSGVVGFNRRTATAVFSDINPHIIAFYSAIRTSQITPPMARAFLESEGAKLLIQGEKYYYEVRDRFNRGFSPLDFLFLSRACFNGMIRFNSKGEFNVPFCRKPQRFSPSYITKIVNQIKYVWEAARHYDWKFECAPFDRILAMASEQDMIYCDPPYLGRHVDYFNSWTEDDERRLYESLSQTKARFILSTWHSNKYRKNLLLDTLWSKFYTVTKEHFYHVGAKEDNRNAITEALVMNFPPICSELKKLKVKQTSLF